MGAIETQILRPTQYNLTHSVAEILDNFAITSQIQWQRFFFFLRCFRGISGDFMLADPYRTFARYLRQQTRQLSKQLPGVIAGEDPECIHKARVACRRIRSLLRVIDGIFPDKLLRGKKLRKTRGQIRDFAQILGPARDLDVHLLKLEELVTAAGDARETAGIRRVQLRLQQRRQQMQPQMVTAVKGFQGKGALSRLQELCESLRVIGCPQRLRVTLAQRTLRKLDELADSLRSQGERASQDADPQVLHETRILIKRLRYTVEFCNGLFAGRFDELLAHLRDLQECLGEINDCFVWGQILENFVVEEKERTHEYFGHLEPFAELEPGIEALRKYWASLLSERYALFRELWQQFHNRFLRQPFVEMLEELQEQGRKVASHEAPPEAGLDVQEPPCLREFITASVLASVEPEDPPKAAGTEPPVSGEITAEEHPVGQLSEQAAAEMPDNQATIEPKDPEPSLPKSSSRPTTRRRQRRQVRPK